MRKDRSNIDLVKLQKFIKLTSVHANHNDIKNDFPILLKNLLHKFLF